MKELKLLSITQEEITKINQEEARRKGLIKEEDFGLYLQLQAIYQKALDTYLWQKTSLSKYEQYLLRQNLPPLPLENRSFHHQASMLPSAYFYIRNFLFIEKLSLEEIAVLKTKKDDTVDLETMKIVMRTFPQIITDNYVRGEYKKNTHTCYGTMIPSHIIPADHLTLVLQYGKSNPPFQDLTSLKNRDQMLTMVATKMEHTLLEELRIPVTVLIYDFVGED